MTRPRDWSPLRSRDPVPGDALEVRALAQRWAGTADAVASAAAGLQAVHASTTEWRSASGRSFQDHSGAVAGQVGRVRERYAAGAQVLHAYARALERAQDDADDALLRARRARDDLEAAERLRRSAVLSPALAAAAAGGGARLDASEQRAADLAADARHRLARADHALAQAEAAWRAAGTAAAAALDEVAQDGLTDRLDGVLDLVETSTQWASRGSAAAGLASLVVPVLAPVALGTGALATAGTAALWLRDRATGTEVALSAVGPVAGVAGRGLRALDDVLPAEALPARWGRAGRGGAQGSRSVPATSGPPGRAPAAATASTRSRRAATAADRVGTASDVATLSTSTPAAAETRTGR